MLDWAAIRISSNPRFKSASMILEIGGGDFSRVASLAKSFPDKNFFSIDMDYSSGAIETTKKYADLPNLNLIKLNAHTAIFAPNIFDFCFSSAVMEHIADIKSFLKELCRIMKKGACYYFIESPFWTSYKGHHYRHDNKDIVKILGGYKHLLYTPQQMEEYLLSLDDEVSLPFLVSECIQRIYYREDLSRLSKTETYNAIKSSDFEIVEWIDMEDECFDVSSAQDVVLKTGYSLADLSVKGAYVTLMK